MLVSKLCAMLMGADFAGVIFGRQKLVDRLGCKFGASGT